MDSIALSLLIVVLASIVALVFTQRERRLRAVQPEIERLCSDLRCSIEYASVELRMSEYESRSALRACDLVRELAQRGDPLALTALPGLTALLARAAYAAEKASANRPIEAHVLDFDAVSSKKKRKP